MIFESCDVSLIILINFRHFIPKRRRVIHVSGVAKFMDNHIINKFKWQVHQSDIQADRSFGGAAAPAAGSVGYFTLCKLKAV